METAQVTALPQPKRPHPDGGLLFAQRQEIDELRSSRQETVERLARALERHDPETGRHVHRIGAISAYLSAKLGLRFDRVLLLRAAAPMHDVGKIAIPGEILRKPGPLSAAERRAMERHTIAGHQILSGSESALLRMAATIALTHHERFDGSGYPQGLCGDEIPLEGRIVAVADVFDALLSNRAYRPALSVGEALETVAGGRGSHFDPEVVDVLLRHRRQVLALRG